VHEDARADADETTDAIRLAFDHGAHRELGLADADRIAEINAKAGEKAALDHGTSVRQRFGKRSIRRVEGYVAIERIGVVHHLQPDHDAAIVPAVSHTVGAHDIAAISTFRNEALKLRFVDGLIGALDLEITAQERCRVLFEPFHHPGIDHAYGSDGGNTEGQAGEKNHRAREAASELASCHAPGKAEIGDHATSSVARCSLPTVARWTGMGSRRFRGGRRPCGIDRRSARPVQTHA